MQLTTNFDIKTNDWLQKIIEGWKEVNQEVVTNSKTFTKEITKKEKLPDKTIVERTYCYKLEIREKDMVIFKGQVINKKNVYSEGKAFSPKKDKSEVKKFLGPAFPISKRLNFPKKEIE